MTQERVQKSKSKSQVKREAVLEETKAKENAEAEKLKAETDELLDEIDGLLEEQDVLVNFRQRGGQ